MLLDLHNNWISILYIFYKIKQIETNIMLIKEIRVAKQISRLSFYYHQSLGFKDSRKPMVIHISLNLVLSPSIVIFAMSLSENTFSLITITLSGIVTFIKLIIYKCYKVMFSFGILENTNGSVNFYLYTNLKKHNLL